VLWASKSGKRLPVQPMKHGDQVLHAVFSRNGLWVLTVERSGKVSVWDAYTGERVTPPLRSLTPSTTARFLAHDRRLAMASEDGAVELWDLRPDDRPVHDLHRIAGLLVGQPEDQSDPLQAQTGTDLQDTWEYLRGRYPNDFSPSR
jgi:WD40 repeat protein